VRPVLGLAKNLKLVPSAGAASLLCLTRLINPLLFTSGQIDGRGPNLPLYIGGTKFRMPAKGHAQVFSLARPQGKRSLPLPTCLRTALA
jgi:hypothetical protein